MKASLSSYLNLGFLYFFFLPLSTSASALLLLFSLLSPVLRSACRAIHRSMDESEFFSVLELFPTVRSASFCLEDDGGDEEERGGVERQGAAKREEKEIPSSSSSSYFEDVEEWMHNPRDKPRGYEEEDFFWIRLREAAEKKLSPEDSARFCHAFRKVHESLVHEVLSSESIGKILKNLKLRHE